MKSLRTNAALLGMFVCLAGNTSAETAAYYKLDQRAAAQLSEQAEARGVNVPRNKMTTAPAPQTRQRAKLDIFIRLNKMAEISPELEFTAEELAVWLKGFSVVEECLGVYLKGNNDVCAESAKVDYQRAALALAAIPWDKITSSEIYNVIAPSLRKENRQFAIQQWANARDNQAGINPEPARREAQAPGKEFEENNSKSLPADEPWDERERRFPKN